MVVNNCELLLRRRRASPCSVLKHRLEVDVLQMMQIEPQERGGRAELHGVSALRDLGDVVGPGGVSSGGVGPRGDQRAQLEV